MMGNELELTGNFFGTIWVAICVVLAIALICLAIWLIVRAWFKLLKWLR